MDINAARRIIVPLDVSTTDEALSIVRLLEGRVGSYKVGLQLFSAEGPEAVRRLRAQNVRVFLDLKLHDIPNTVARSIAQLRRLDVDMLDVHLAGGEQMLRAAVAAVKEPAGAAEMPPRPLLLGITVLTSLDERDLPALGVERSIADQAVALARLAQKAGLDGVVSSPHEIGAIKRACGAQFVVVTPGVRPAGSAAGDQKRYMTPAQAVAAGADYLVIGRPILEAPDPIAAVEAIAREISG